MKICPSCEIGKLRAKKVNSPYAIRGKIFTVSCKTVFVCDNCGEKITTAREMHRIEKFVKALF